MQRVAFQLRIREGCEQTYDDIHLRVWPELLIELEAAGVFGYSIFRRDQELFLYLEVAGFDAFLDYLDKSDVDRRWQEMMASMFVKVPSLRSGERFAMMKEVFHMASSREPDSNSNQKERKPNEG